MRLRRRFQPGKDCARCGIRIESYDPEDAEVCDRCDAWLRWGEREAQRERDGRPDIVHYLRAYAGDVRAKWDLNTGPVLEAADEIERLRSIVNLMGGTREGRVMQNDDPVVQVVADFIAGEVGFDAPTEAMQIQAGCLLGELHDAGYVVVPADELHNVAIPDGAMQVASLSVRWFVNEDGTEGCLSRFHGEQRTSTTVGDLTALIHEYLSEQWEGRMSGPDVMERLRRQVAIHEPDIPEMADLLADAVSEIQRLRSAIEAAVGEISVLSVDLHSAPLLDVATRLYLGLNNEGERR